VLLEIFTNLPPLGHEDAYESTPLQIFPFFYFLITNICFLNGIAPSLYTMFMHIATVVNMINYTKFRGLGPRTNYTHRVAAACRGS
jgi:hypothetical protein